MNRRFNGGCFIEKVDDTRRLGITDSDYPRLMGRGEISLPDAIGKEVVRIEELNESKNETIYDEEWRNGVGTGSASLRREVKIFFRDGTWIKISK